MLEKPSQSSFFQSGLPLAMPLKAFGGWPGSVTARSHVTVLWGPRPAVISKRTHWPTGRSSGGWSLTWSLLPETEKLGPTWYGLASSRHSCYMTVLASMRMSKANFVTPSRWWGT